MYHNSAVVRTYDISPSRGWTKSTNGALPRDSIELNARQNEKIKNLKRQEKKTVDRGLRRVDCKYNGTKYAECDGNDRH